MRFNQAWFTLELASIFTLTQKLLSLMVFDILFISIEFFKISFKKFPILRIAIFFIINL